MNHKLQKKQWHTGFAFWLMSLSIVFGLTLPWLFKEGMFQDAMLYSCVSHNMGIGIGTFWFPQYSTLNLEGIPSFHEQLPLVFGIQSVLYRLFGDSILIERFYTFAMILLTIFLMAKIWKSLFYGNDESTKHGWLPIFFWVLIPLTFWSYRYNMMENTVGVFALASVWFALKAVNSSDKSFLLWLISGAFVFLSSFSKGIPGFFPITFPVLYWLVTRKISFFKSIWFSFYMALIPVLMYGIFIAHPTSRESLSIYFFDRLLTRTSVMPTVEYRLEILVRLFFELLPTIIVVLFIIVFTKGWKRGFPEKETLQRTLLFLGIGLAGTLPLMLTMVQKGFYMVPAFPFFSIAFGLIAIHYLNPYLKNIKPSGVPYRIFLISSAVLLIGIGIFTYATRNEIAREKNIITDVYKIGTVVPKFSTVTVPEEMYDQYNFILQGYTVRLFNISISPYQQYEFYLKEKALLVDVPEGYKKIDLNLVTYELYRKD